ncbi:MAG: alpha-L-fucosidase [Haliscomenobacter sp.]|nr:alpha-L-fucosidase [Haliscomenobacter sp.]
MNPSGWIFNKPMPAFPFRDLLRTMIYTISRDGNYLLDVGPMPDGTLYPPDAERLGLCRLHENQRGSSAWHSRRPLPGWCLGWLYLQRKLGLFIHLG